MLWRSKPPPSVSAPPLRSIIIGLRVTHRADGRHALVVSKPESNGSTTQLVRVIVEGTTRYEQWPLHLLDVRPTIQQARNLGGQYDPPQGYPLCI
jgi:hypothetical protein